MAPSRLELRGRRGWLAVATLTLALAAIVGSQAHSSVAHADLTPLAATTPLSPTVTDSPSPEAATVVPDVPVAVAPVVANPAKRTKPAKAAPRRTAPSDVCAGPGWQAKRGQAALATLRDTGQRSGVTVSFLGAKSGYLGLTYPERHHVDVFIRSCSTESATLLRHVMSHEMGHAYDAAHMTPALRDAYERMRGIPAGTPWFGCNYCTDFNTPAGDFAETYSQWQRGSHDSRTQIAPMPNSTQLAAIAAAFFQG
ncbi:MAG: hypothetical protein JWP11_3492 [Frankiales bacterium]|nr:hypothetical protein [Frankiales bacterium]